MASFSADLELPERRTVRLRNEVDRYGFSHLLARKAGIPRPRRPFAAWLHGWVFWDAQSSDELGYADAPRDMPVVVARPEQKSLFDKAGFLRTVVGGLPFAYTEPSGKPRLPNSAVAFIPHSLAHLKNNTVPTEFLDYLASIRKDFERFRVCLFGHDVERVPLVAELRRRELEFISGAQPEDANSLTRMRWLFDQFDYLIACGMGSHLLYAAFCGCRPSIPGPYLPEDPDQFRSDPYFTRHPHILEKCLRAFDECVNRERSPWLFVEHPRSAPDMRRWAIDEIGSKHLLSAHEIADILGWSAMGQVRGALRGALRRTKRGAYTVWHSLRSRQLTSRGAA